MTTKKNGLFSRPYAATRWMWQKNKRGESYEKTVIVIRRLLDRHSIFQPSYLGLLLKNVAFWLFDLAQLKAKKFTDKYGYTIRE